MNFREEVKALLEANPGRKVDSSNREARPGEEGVTDEKSSSSRKRVITGRFDPNLSDERVKAGRQGVSRSMMKAVLDKLRAEAGQDLAHTEISFREKVKALLEGEDKPKERITMAHPESQKAGTQGPAGAIKVTPEQVKEYQAKGWEVVKENSNHPFYQRVKALSRGKKNNSLLEKKSKTVKFLIAKLAPCGKKSKMEEAKKDKPERTGGVGDEGHAARHGGEQGKGKTNDLGSKIQKFFKGDPNRKLSDEEWRKKVDDLLGPDAPL